MPITQKRKRAKVLIGYDAQNKPIYKWASGWTKKELAENVECIKEEWGIVDHHRRRRTARPVAVYADNVTLPAPQEKPPQTVPVPAPAASISETIPSTPTVMSTMMPEEPPQRDDGPTFRDYADEWYRLYKQPSLRASSRAMYDNVLNVHLYPIFGALPIKAISRNDLQKFILDYSGSSKSLIDKILLTLRQIFDAAMEDEIIVKNPVKKLRPPEGTEKERLPITMDAVQAVTDAAKRHQYGVMPLLMMYAGLRRGELIGLRWEDIDGDWITIQRAVVYEDNKTAVVGDTKTKSGKRRVPLLPVVRDALGKPSKGYVVGNGAEPLPYTSFKRHWDKLRADIPALQGVTPHQLRHTYLMLLRRAGVDAATQQHLMGHADYETTVNDYTHIDAFDEDAALNKLFTALPNLPITDKRPEK